MDLGGLGVVVEGHRVDVPPGALAEIGRDEDCEVQVSDPRVSRRHAVVWSTPDGWMVADRDSSGGTWLGEERVSQRLISTRTSLRLGDASQGPTLELIPLTASRGISVRPASVSGTTPPATRPTGSFRTLHGATTRVRIGRDADNEIVIDDLLVSRHHAELHDGSGGRKELVDLGSLNGTYVNGSAVKRAVVTDLDLIGIGHSEFRVVGQLLEEYVDSGRVTFEATDVTVTGNDGATLVDDVGFALPERSLFAIVGPSGSGKSTLLAALSGVRPAPVGRVLYGGRDLYRSYAELRRRIGLVPQEDVLHLELRLRRALEYAGRLRFPADVSAQQRDERVDEVLEELGIRHRADSPIHRLSGGERKRTNVALELLTRPSLLFLDEPASGLDPGLASVLMGMLRELADGGRTVVVVTHELSSLSLCDQILVLAPGGVPAYVGPPRAAPGSFGRETMTEVFTDLVTGRQTDWPRQRTTPSRPPRPAPAPPAAAPARPAARTVRQGWWSQLRTLTQRYVEVLASDRRNAILLLLQAPILGLILLAALPPGELARAAESEVRLVSAAGIVLFVIVVGVTWLGANNAISEIARELPMYRRERAAGLSVSAYVASKALVLAALTATQSVVLVALATARQGGPGEAVLLGWAPGELMAVVALAGIASMALGLFVSAATGSPERATSILPVVLILQLVLAAGVVLPEIVDKPVLNQLSLASSTQWGIAGAASTVDLNELQVFDDRLRDLRSVDATNTDPAVEALVAAPTPQSRWAHTASAWLAASGALVGLTLIFLVGTGLALRRYDPGRT